MSINGYSDLISVRPGDTIQFMVSCDEGESFRADIVRLIHGDLASEGPGFKEEELETTASGEYPARRQAVLAGSYVAVPAGGPLGALESFSLGVLLLPTTPDKGEQGLLTSWSAEAEAGYALCIDDKGQLALWLGGHGGPVARLSSGRPLMNRVWYYAAASFDAASGRMALVQLPVLTRTNGRYSLVHPAEGTASRVEGDVGGAKLQPSGAPFLMAGWAAGEDASRLVVGGRYNGKLERPWVSSEALNPDELAASLERPAASLVATWDFAAGITERGVSTSQIVDLCGRGLHGRTVNMPARAMTGHNWTSEEHKFVHAPNQYGAIHFHDDDLDDARWQVDFSLEVPAGTGSGLYAARLHGGGDEDYVPFYVRPAKDAPPARIAFLAPTASYMAYANDHITTNAALAELLCARTLEMDKYDLFLAEHREYGLSCYDTHSDGSGVCYSTRLRPMLNQRPKHYSWQSPSVWQFNADLHLIDWLTEKGLKFDVLTDEDLHREGVEALRPYKVVLTGSHPEYYSSQMLDGWEEYVQDGGRMMYMGANGFYWITQYHPENPAVIEVRRWGGSQAWRAAPGEYNLSFTGELGGLWRNRGRAPQKVAGTGFIAEGFDVSSYYRRKPDSFDPRAAWIFEGVGDDELIGEFGLVGGGAAGLELDIYDTALGTPEHALVLASSENHTDVYLEVLEELFFNVPAVGGTENPRVRADMVYYPAPNDGAVFSTSSIAWCGSLSHNGYDNNVSRITENVVRRFAADEPLPW